MDVTRRDFVGLTAGGAIAGALSSLPRSLMAEPSASIQGGPPTIKAIAFDAFPLFDPRPVGTVAEEVAPGKGAALVAEWRTRQFEYAWLRALSRKYVDFWQITKDALGVAERQVQVELSTDARDRLLNVYLQLPVWPDVVPTLAALQKLGMRLAIVSNMSPTMLDSNITHAKLDGVFEHVLSTDRIKSYKPDPRAYQLSVDAFQLRKEEILFVAFAGWDAAGAKAYGHPTFWANRLDAATEVLGNEPDGMADALSPIPSFAAAIGK